MVLFAVIDITGAVPIINDIQNKGHTISAIKAALASYILLVAFLFVGDGLLNLFSVDISSFAVAGSLVIFVLAVEMIFGIPIFKNDSPSGTASIVPLVFPLIVGAGTLTTLLALRRNITSSTLLRFDAKHYCRLFRTEKMYRWSKRYSGKVGFIYYVNSWVSFSLPFPLNSLPATSHH